MEPTEYTDLVLEVAADMRAYNEQAAICVQQQVGSQKSGQAGQHVHDVPHVCLHVPFVYVMVLCDLPSTTSSNSYKFSKSASSRNRCMHIAYPSIVST